MNADEEPIAPDSIAEDDEPTTGRGPGEGDDDIDSDDDDYDGEYEDGIDSSVSINIAGLSVYTHHGVSAAEREVGQRLLLDISFELEDNECDALLTDDVNDTVDYGVVCEQVWLVAQERSYKTLERLCSVICDHLMDHFGTDEVTVRATKPEPPIPMAVGSVSVEVWKLR